MKATRFNQMLISFGLLSVGYTALNVFIVGGDQFILDLNNYLTIPLALAVTFAAFRLARQVGAGDRYRVIWWSFFTGFGLWSVAQVWWAVAAALTGEVPYPSWADAFWVIGYLPLYIALGVRLRSLPHYATPLQNLWIWLTSLVMIGLTGWFVLLPILQSYDPADLVVSVLNLLYPLVDIVLLVYVLRIFFSYQQGRYAHAWIWLCAGFILMTISDFIFSYATTAGTYYPDGQANLVSTLLVDVPYNLSYLAWLIGLIDLQMAQSGLGEMTAALPALEPVPNTHLYLSTREDNTILGYSQNFAPLFSLPAPTGVNLAQALGIDPGQVQTLVDEIRHKGRVAERQVETQASTGSLPTRISGLGFFEPDGRYLGDFFLLRLWQPVYQYDKMLSDYDRDIISNLMKETGAQAQEEQEIRALLIAVYQSSLLAFYPRLFLDGGSIMIEGFISHLEQVAAQNGWDVRFPAARGYVGGEGWLQPGDISLEDLRCALPELVNAARAYVAHVIDAKTADNILSAWRASLSEELQQHLAYFETVLPEPPSAPAR